MVRLREISRTAAFAWSPGTGPPYLATGTRAGAVDADFSNDTQLELWDLDLDNKKQGLEIQPVASIDTDSRQVHVPLLPRWNDEFPKGVIAGALENGSLDLWNAEKLLEGQGDSFMSRTSKHSGAIKTLQFNPFRSELLATAGAKGELFISDLKNIHSPFRMGNSVARADDFECLDWNKNVPHIMVTGSSGGFVTVWDVKTKKESLTLNNLGRKAVSAVAWDPDKHTRLITAIPHDTDPLILVWDLRNSNAPERVLRGHDGGVLSLSWCSQDNGLLLSCGKDNRTICWNPQTGESYGEFPVVTNWTFQTRWNPHNPNLLATASFDGKIGVQSIQNTNSDVSKASGSQTQTINDEDFFNKAQSQPQGASFTLLKAPKWLERPCGVSFGFGGKVLSFTSNSAPPRTSTLRISMFAIDDRLGTSTDAFENALKAKDLQSICKSKIATASLDAEKADWKVIETLTLKNPRKHLVDYLGFSNGNGEATASPLTLATNGESKEESAAQLNVLPTSKSNRLSAFFDPNADGDSFLSDLAATKGAKTNNPFQVYSGSESESDKKITHALLLGQFEKALDVCLQEDRLSDAFMVAICGGQACIDKAQKAYFNRKAEGPNYLRLLASVVGKNLWDVVYNAELGDWKEIMAIICTYASVEEFPDLCEALGDRLDEQMKIDDGEGIDLRKNASFCYLAGSKLEKVVTIWIAELDNNEEVGLEGSSTESSYSIHARLLQSFIEKVTVFREVTHFQDGDRKATSGWRLGPLYNKYTEYADIVASHGQLHIAEKYLDLLPEKHPVAEIARNRIKEAIRKSSAPTTTTTTRQPTDSTRSAQRLPASMASFQDQPSPAKPIPSGQRNPYAPSAPSESQKPRTQTSNAAFKSSGYADPAGYQQPYQLRQQSQAQPGIAPPPTFGAPPPAYGATYQSQISGPPSRNVNASPSIAPPSRSQNMSNWNDTPESFFKPPTSRRGTPGVGTSVAPMSAAYSSAVQPSNVPSYGIQPKSTPPLAPPPKGPTGPPSRMNSPSINTSQSFLPPERPSSSAANAYAPQQPLSPLGSVPSLGSISNLGSVQQQASVARGPSPYNAPPSAPPPSNRYAPAPSAQPATPSIQQEGTMIPGSSRQGPPPPNPYAPQQNHALQQQTSSIQSSTPSAISPSSRPPPRSVPSSGPQQGPAQSSRPETAQSQRAKVATPIASKHPIGDRSHIPASARAVFEILSRDMQRVKARAPQSFKPQVNDTEKRLNILFDHLNNEDLLKEQTVLDMVQLAQALQSRDYEQAQTIHVDIMTNRTEECGNWMVGVKRLIGMSRATP